MSPDPVPSTLPAKVKSQSQPSRVVEAVKSRILQGELQPGDRVPPEPELMRTFGVSRSVVREAVSMLQASGMVETRHGIGTFVLGSPATQPLLARGHHAVPAAKTLAMLELRITVESEAASLAALRRTPAHLQRMHEALQAHEAAAAAGQDTVELDFSFHAHIAAATDNEFFVEVLRNLGLATIGGRAAAQRKSASAGAAMRFGRQEPALASTKSITSREHRAVLDAIERQDAPAARAAMFMHLTNSRERYRTQVSDDTALGLSG